MKFLRSKRAVIFNVFVAIMVLLALSYAYILLENKTDVDMQLGVTPMELFLLYSEGDRVLSFIDSSAQASLREASIDLQDLGIDSLNCHSYFGFSVWEDGVCLPDKESLEKTLISKFSSNLRDRLMQYPNITFTKYVVGSPSGSLTSIPAEASASAGHFIYEDVSLPKGEGIIKLDDADVWFPEKISRGLGYPLVLILGDDSLGDGTRNYASLFSKMIQRGEVYPFIAVSSASIISIEELIDKIDTILAQKDSMIDRENVLLVVNGEIMFDDLLDFFTPSSIAILNHIPSVEEVNLMDSVEQIIVMMGNNRDDSVKGNLISAEQPCEFFDDEFFAYCVHSDNRFVYATRFGSVSCDYPEGSDNQKECLSDSAFVESTIPFRFFESHLSKVFPVDLTPLDLGYSVEEKTRNISEDDDSSVEETYTHKGIESSGIDGVFDFFVSSDDSKTTLRAVSKFPIAIGVDGTQLSQVLALTPTAGSSPISIGPGSGVISGDGIYCSYCDNSKRYLNELYPGFDCGDSKCCEAPCPQGSAIIGGIDYIAQASRAQMGPGDDCWNDPEITYGRSACGVAALRMAFSAKGVKISSKDLFCEGPNNIYTPKKGSRSASMRDVVDNLGLSGDLELKVKTTDNKLDWERIVSNIRDGNPVVMSINDKSPVESGLILNERCRPVKSHFMTIVGATNNFVIVNDPMRSCGDNSNERMVLSRKFVEAAGKSALVIS